MAKRSPEGTWLSEDEQRAWRAFLQMHRHLTVRLNRELIAHSDISDADYAVLVALSEAADGRLRPFELGRETQWEKSRLSHHLTRMEKRGLIQREDCPTDARGAFVVLSDDGWATIRGAAPQHVATVRRFFAEPLGPEQLSQLTAIADAVVDALAAEDGDDAQPTATRSTGS